MNILVNLLKRDIYLNYKIHKLIAYFFIYLIFCTSSTSLINVYANSNFPNSIILIICISLAFINLGHNLIKSEIADGSIELLLILSSPEKIILSKYIALCFSCSTALMFNLLCNYFLLNLDYKSVFIIAILSTLLIMLGSALTLLIAVMRGYFHTETGFITILIIPLILPNMILSSMILCYEVKYNILSIIFGINMIIIPFILYCTTYLIKNIYHISH